MNDDDLDFGATIQGFRPGQKLFNRYTLARILGRGGMGVVWQARDEELERDIALKFLPELVLRDRSAIDDLKRETRRSLELTHPHIVRIHDFVQDAQAAAISMEYVDGETLGGLRVDRESKVFEPRELGEWVKELCSALDYAHAKARIVHRDLKPSNLMVNGRGELKVTDFGIARSLTDSVSLLTANRHLSGTLVYMSPQQLEGERSTHGDDIYSLGATLYELLTGKPPFYSGNIDRQIREKAPLSLAARREELGIAGEPLPPEWEETIAACLHKDPACRPQSAGEVAYRLGLVASYEPIAVGENAGKTSRPQIVRVPGLKPPDVGEGRPSVQTASAPKKRGGLFALALILLMVGAAAGWWFGMEAPRREAIAQAEADAKTAEEARIKAAEEKAAAEAEATRKRIAEAEAKAAEAERLRLEAEAERKRLADLAEAERIRKEQELAEAQAKADAAEKARLAEETRRAEAARLAKETEDRKKEESKRKEEAAKKEAAAIAEAVNGVWRGTLNIKMSDGQTATQFWSIAVSNDGKNVAVTFPDGSVNRRSARLSGNKIRFTDKNSADGSWVCEWTLTLSANRKSCSAYRSTKFLFGPHQGITGTSTGTLSKQ